MFHYSWSNDGRQIAYEVETDKHTWNAYMQPVASGPPILVKKDLAIRSPVLARRSDGSFARRALSNSPLLQSGGQQIAVKAAQNQQYPIRLVKNGQVLLVAEPTGGELVLTVIDLASGRRDLWARIADGHPSRHNQLFAATPDVKYYVYPFPRFSSVLYAVQNLH